LPLALGRGECIGRVMTRLLPSIFAVMV
jgi:hypothetical protein